MSYVKKKPVEFFFKLIIFILLAEFSKQEECDLTTIDTFVADKTLKTLDFEVWNKFEKLIFTNLSSYDVQKDTDGFLQKIVEDKPGSTSWKVKIDEYIKQIHRTIRSYSLTQLQSQKLNYLLNISLVDKITISNCSESDVTVAGHFVTLKNALNILNTHCQGQDLNSKRSIKFFALNTLYIDVDINLSVSMIFIAPKWEIIGKRSINLSGRNANDYKKDPEIIELQKTVNKRAEDGQPGIPGESGGFFYGVADQIIHEEFLTITSNGGNGGDGKNGEQGKEGETAAGIEEWCKEDLKINPENWSLYNRNTHLQKISNRKVVEGAKGLLGGHGGAKGAGGAAGNVVLINLNKVSDVKVNRKDGKNGIDGKAGIGGDGGFNVAIGFYRCEGKIGERLSSNILAVFKSNLDLAIKECIRKKFGYGKEDEENIKFCRKNLDKKKFKRAASGEKGTDGNIKFSQELVFNISLVNITNEYQHYFRENFKINMAEFHKIDFIEKLNKNTAIYNFTSYQYLLDEINQIENESLKVDRDTDLSPFYEILLDKIDSYAKAAESSQHSLVEKQNLRKYLEYLFAVTLSRKSSMNENLGTYLITNVPLYLKNLVAEFEKLKKLNTDDRNEFNKNVFENVEVFKNKFHEDLKIKSSAAKDVVEKDLQFEINNITQEFNTEMVNLKKEINVEIKNTIEQGQKLEKTRNIIKKHLIAEVINNVADAVCSALQLAGPKGAMAAALIQVPTKFFTNTLDRENNLQLSTISAINNSTQKSFQSLNTKLKTMKENKHKKIAGMMSEIKKVQEKNKLPDNNLSRFIKYLNDSTDGLNSEKVTYDKLSEIEKDLNQKIKEENINIKGSKKNDWKGLTKILDNMEKIAFLPDATVGVITAFTNYSLQTDKLEKTIQQNKDLLESLKDFEKNVYPHLMKKLEELVTEVNKIRNEVGNKSKVKLDFFKIKATQVFDDTKDILNRNLADYKMKDRLFYVIGRLEGILPFLITTNNVIQDIYEQGNLVQVISDMLKVPYQDNHPLKTKLDLLKERVLSNILLKKYKLVYRALEQYVFPFANDFLKDENAPEKLTPGLRLNDFMNRIVEFTTAINNKIEYYHRSIRISDSKRETTYFYSPPKGVADPFFIWRNSDYKSVILELLSGKEVFLNADIKKQLMPFFDAIKVNEVTLNFKVNTTERHKKFHELLGNFKITLSHLGNNYYTYKKKIYFTNTKPVDVSYYFKCYGEEKPCASDSWNKLKDNPGMLSPYTMWKVKLEPPPRKESTVSFEDLKAFANEIDLELEGIGPAVPHNSKEEKLYPYKSMQTCDIPEKITQLPRSKRHVKY